MNETADPKALAWLKALEGVDLMRERFPLEDVLAAFGMHRSTCYEWRKRLREDGVKGLVRRSSKPKSHRGLVALTYINTIPIDEIDPPAVRWGEGRPPASSWRQCWLRAAKGRGSGT